MKSDETIFPALILPFSVLFLMGCANTEHGHTSHYQPGPVAGRAVGNIVGFVAGNTVGAGVGVVEGTTQAFSAPFNPCYHMVRHWKTETTSDGRVVQVPVDVLVDQYGRPVSMPAPTGNPSTQPVAPTSE